MRIQLKTAVIALLLAGPALKLRAGYEDVGIGSRPMGMGGAFAAIADDANAVYWNPAGLMQVKRQEALFMHGIYGGVAGVNFDYLAYVYPMAYSAIGVGWSETGATLEEGDGASATSSRINEDMYYLTAGLNPALFGNDQLTVGATLKRLTLDSKIDSGSGMGFDFGALFRPYPWAQAALVLRNVATDVRNEKFNSTWRFGLGSRLFSDRVRLAMDVNSKDGIGTTDGTNYLLHFGAEVAPWKIMALRVGMDDGAMTAGVGFDYASFKIDYGYKASELVGNAHRVSLGVSFGPDGSTYVRTESAKAAAVSSIVPPKGLKGGYVEGRVLVFWEASPSVGVAGYNLYLKGDGDKWSKVNESLIWEDKKAASMKADKGETYHLAVTAVGIDKVESDKSEELEVIAR